MIKISEIVEYKKNEKESFRLGQLREEWAARYPQLFDEDDLRLARGQPKFHFVEWFGAIYFFKKSGYLSLVEQYIFRNHKRKGLIVSQIMPPTLIEFMRKSWIQPPDLLVFAPDLTERYFCEVKSPTDQVSAKQEDYFSQLEVETGKPVYLLKLREKR